MELRLKLASSAYTSAHHQELLSPQNGAVVYGKAHDRDHGCHAKAVLPMPCEGAQKEVAYEEADVGASANDASRQEKALKCFEMAANGLACAASGRKVARNSS